MKRLIVVMLAAACGGSRSASPEEIARFVGDWGGGITTQYTCGTQAQQPISGGLGIPLTRGTDADLQYTSSGGCLFKFRVDGHTAALSNAPVKCAADGANWTFTDYTLTTTDGVHATLNVAGGVVDGGGACSFTMTGALCLGRCGAPPDPASLEVVSGADQTGVAGSTLPLPIRVRTRASDGSAAPGATVLFQIEAGAGSVSAHSVTTDQDGIASVVWTLGTAAPSPQSLVVETFFTPYVRITAAAVPGPPQTVTITSDPDELVIGAPVQLIATARDAYGNAIANVTPVWSTSAPLVAAVSETGNATALTFGTTTIDAKVGDVEGSREYVVDALLAAYGTPTVNGILAPGEWNEAASTPVAVNVPEGTAQARLYVMNDDNDIYLALWVDGARTPSSLVFEFDSRRDGIHDDGDDNLVLTSDSGFVDSMRNRTDCSGLCNVPDTSVGETNDGDGRLVSDGSATMYELWHPLMTFDPTDIRVRRGDRIPMSMFLRVADASGVLHDTFYPDDTRFLQVRLK